MALRKIFPIFSGFDLTFSYIWCIFYKIREGLRPGKVKRSTTQREQSLEKMAHTTPNLFNLRVAEKARSSDFHTETRSQSIYDERSKPFRTSLEGVGATSAIGNCFAIQKT